MNRIKKTFVLLQLIVSATLTNPTNSLANHNSDKHWYIGTEHGFSTPVVHEFKEEDSTFILRESSMKGGKIGYSFYPGMSIELSGTHQPSYTLSYQLPQDLNGDTKVRTNVFTLNYIHELKQNKLGINPYFIAGIGMSRVSIAQTITYIPGGLIKAFSIDDNKMNCMTYQVGAGFKKNLTKNISLDFAGKLQVIKDAEIKYSSLDAATLLFESRDPVKKTLGLWEFTVGITFEIPAR